MDKNPYQNETFDSIRFRRRSTVSFTAIAPPAGARKPFLTKYSSTSLQEYTSTSRERAGKGNYRGYVGYRDEHGTSAERLKDLPSLYFKNKNCLDVGCNTGDLTVEVAKKFAPRYIIGIDMDDDLVGKANSRVRNLALHSKATFMVPRALATGQLKESKKGMDLFPKNVKFVCWDIMNDDEKGYALGDMEYDTIMCMSVVKWIHLNNGDEGLIKFFRRLHGLCILGGHVVIEYQPWKSYVNNRNASEVCKYNFENNISIRPEDFERILEEDIGFTIVDRRGTDLRNAKGFNRPILVLKKENLHILSAMVSELDEGKNDGEFIQSDTDNESKGREERKKKKKKKKKRNRVDVEEKGSEHGDKVVFANCGEEDEHGSATKKIKTDSQFSS